MSPATLIVVIDRIIYAIVCLFIQLIENTTGADCDVEIEDEKSLKAKLCLYIESLYAAVEIGMSL